MSIERLNDLVDAWFAWSRGADQDEDGWESSFDRWQELMEVATAVMHRGLVPLEAIPLLERCWAISEEAEELQSFAASNIDLCWSVVVHLAHSSDPRVRWQALTAAASAGARAEPLLREALADVDAYVRRRAILALALLRPRDLEALSCVYVDDADPYIRQASVELIVATDDLELMLELLTRLADDESDNVRQAARTRLATLDRVLDR